MSARKREEDYVKSLEGLHKEVARLGEVEERSLGVEERLSKLVIEADQKQDRLVGLIVNLS